MLLNQIKSAFNFVFIQGESQDQNAVSRSFGESPSFLSARSIIKTVTEARTRGLCSSASTGDSISPGTVCSFFLLN